MTQSIAKLCLHETAQHRKMRTYSHTSSGIRTHDHSNWTVQDHKGFRPRCHI